MMTATCSVLRCCDDFEAKTNHNVELDFSNVWLKLEPASTARAYRRSRTDARRTGKGRQSETIWAILSVSYSGKEVNLHIPNTSLQRFRVMVADLVYIEPASIKAQRAREARD